MTSFEVVQYSIRVPLNLSKLIIQIEIRIVVIPSPDLLSGGRFHAICDLVSTRLSLFDNTVLEKLPLQCRCVEVVRVS